MSHPKRNEIYKALGSDKQLGKEKDDFETGTSPFLPGDMLLLCSDGLTDLVNAEKIRTILTEESSLKEKSLNLVNEANRLGGKDNITAVLVQNNKTQQQVAAKKPIIFSKKNTEATVKSIPSDDSPSVNTPQHETKIKRGPVKTLTFFMLVFLGVAVWEYLQNPNNMVTPTVKVVTPVKKGKNSQEIKLQQAIYLTNDHVLVLSDTAYTSPILISEAIQINKDSLLIKTKGKIVFQCDSGYKGPAFQLTSKCKNVVLDSLSFQDFQIGIASLNNGLKLKNIRFNNCQVPLQNGFNIPEKKYINGKFPAVVFKSDTAPVISK